MAGELDPFKKKTLQIEIDFHGETRQLDHQLESLIEKRKEEAKQQADAITEHYRGNTSVEGQADQKAKLGKVHASADKDIEKLKKDYEGLNEYATQLHDLNAKNDAILAEMSDKLDRDKDFSQFKGSTEGISYQQGGMSPELLKAASRGRAFRQGAGGH